MHMDASFVLPSSRMAVQLGQVQGFELRVLGGSQRMSKNGSWSLQKHPSGLQRRSKSPGRRRSLLPLVTEEARTTRWRVEEEEEEEEGGGGRRRRRRRAPLSSS